MSSETWEQSLTVRIGTAIKRLRGKRSAQWLADETAKFGYAIGRATISEIETGRRRTITVAELFVLARALNAAPVTLVFPDPTDDQSRLVEALPGVEVTEFEAAQWFSGHGRAFLPPDQGLRPGEFGREVARARTEFDSNTATLSLARQIAQWREQLYSIIVPINGELTDKQREYRDYCEAQIDFLANQIAAANGDD